MAESNQVTNSGGSISVRASTRPDGTSSGPLVAPTRASTITWRANLTDRSVFYLALNPVTCLAEVFQKTRTIHREQRKPALVGFALTSVLRLLDLTGSFATRLRGSMGLMTGPRSIGRNWARGLYAAYSDAQGIAYPPPCTEMPSPSY